MTAPESSAAKTPAGPASRVFRLLRRLLPWLALAAVFALIFWKIPFAKVVAEFKTMTPTQILSLSGLALAFILGVCAIDAVALKYAFGVFGIKIAWRELFLVRAATMVLVAIASPVGQAGIAGHLVRTKRAPLGPAAGMIMFLMMIEFYGMLAVATVCFPLLLFVKGDALPSPAPALLSAAMIVGLWPLLFIVIRLSQSQTGIALLGRLRLASLAQPLQAFGSTQVLKLLLLKTILAAWQIALTLPAFRLYHINLPGLDLFAFMPLAIIVSSIPITPARLGITQLSWAMFFHYAVPDQTLVAFSLLFQVLINLARWLIGAAALPFIARAPAGGDEGEKI